MTLAAMAREPKNPSPAPPAVKESSRPPRNLETSWIAYCWY